MLYGGATGFTVAALVASAFEFFTGEPLNFEIPSGTGPFGWVTGVLLRLIAGPYLIARSMIQLMRDGEAQWVVLGGGLLVASWSLSSGIVFIGSFMLLGS